MTTLTPRQNLFVQVLISISLALIVTVGFTWIRFYGVENVADEEDQASYHTHDINVIKEHRKPYVGDNSNTVQTLYALPLASRINRIEIRDTSVVVILDDGDTADERENVLYSSLAFMAAIDNASLLTYLTPNGSYIVERTALEERFGTPLSAMLDSPDSWQGARALIPVEASSLVIGD